MPEGKPILIVGAGPSGLTLAIGLAKRGIPFRIVDRLERGLNTSRAVAVHARTLEVLEEYGVTELLRARGVTIDSFAVRERARLLARISFTEIPSRYRGVLLVPQEITEACLEQKLEELGGRVERGTEFLGVDHAGAGVRAEISRGGNKEIIEAAYLVAADGMHSRVREAAGVKFSGGAYEESFVLADVTMAWPFGKEEGTILFGEDGLALVVPLPNDHFRIVATLANAPKEPDIGVMQAVLDRSAPAEARIEKVYWSSRFHVHHRLADHFVAEKIILLGDAAHVHSPAGGQGMNLGIRDAAALARALGEGAPSSLARWEKDRRRQAARVIRFTDRMTRVGISRNPLVKRLRNLALTVLGGLAGIRPALARRLAGLADR